MVFASLARSGTSATLPTTLVRLTGAVGRRQPARFVSKSLSPRSPAPRSARSSFSDFTSSSSSSAAASVRSGSWRSGLLVLGAATVFGIGWMLSHEDDDAVAFADASPAPADRGAAELAASVKEDTENLAEYEEPQQPIIKAKYVIVGFGVTGYSAWKHIRLNDPDGEILVISREEEFPYMRPPLSKNLWLQPAGADDAAAGKFLDPATGKPASVFVEEDPAFFTKDKHTQFLMGSKTELKFLHATENFLELADGTRVDYEKCLLATGGRARVLMSVPTDTNVHTYRTIADYRRLHAAVTRGDAKDVLVVGGGFLGTELACALAHHSKSEGVNVTQVFPGAGPMSSVFPDYLVADVEQELHSAGVSLKPGRRVSALTSKAPADSTADGEEASGGRMTVRLDDGSSLEADHIVVCAGIAPAISFARLAMLEIDAVNGGIVVNRELSARHDLYVAGDAASFYHPVLGRRRVDHYDHAVNSGALAGENMSCAPHTQRSYNYVPSFWGDIGSLSYEAVGIIDPRLETVAVFDSDSAAASAARHSSSTTSNGSADAASPQSEVTNEATAAAAANTAAVTASASDVQGKSQQKRGVVYYLNERKRVVGVLLWGLPNKLSSAREMLVYGRPIEQAEDLISAISFKASDSDDDAATAAGDAIDNQE